jgi:hypothetical protein
MVLMKLPVADAVEGVEAMAAGINNNVNSKNSCGEYSGLTVHIER